MPLSSGDKLGPYEILAPIGAGGMGEVYRAKDTKLGREVAIKVLPAAFAQHPERLARFEREAKVLASLNHPNIAQIYGLFESNNAESGAGRALVMELVQGETLKGPVPVDTALKYAAQIANALDAAHEKGIIHRDLKPANIMLTPDGVIKVLDFGLAAVTQPSVESTGDPNQSPTLTMGSTQAGTIMGTAGYMSPEQASGKPVDRRADIWSFGVVLWEMLTGKRLFEGETISHTLAAVLTQNQDLQQVPVKARRLLQSCLQKDAKRRLQAMGDWWLLVDETPRETEPAARSKLPWAVAAALAIVAAGFAALWLRPAPLPEVVRFEVNAPSGSTLPLGTPAPSPDGRTLAYTVRGQDGIVRIHVRSMDSTESRALPGTENAVHPFWSPDGRSLAFAANGDLKRIDLAGGSARTLTSVEGPWHGSWNQAGIILFQPGLAIARIPAEGGAITPVLKLDEKKGETSGGFPFFLPDGKRFLVNVTHGDGSRDIELTSLVASSGSGDRKVILPDVTSAPILASAPNGTNYLLYLRGASLMAQDFDEKAGAVRGGPFLLVDGVGRVAATGSRPSVGVSPSGVLAYQTGGDAQPLRLGWFDRSGKLLKELPPEAGGLEPELSPDGRFAALRKTLGTDSDIWLVDLARGSSTRLTFGSSGKSYSNPIWSPDGKRVAYALTLGGIYAKDANGTGAEQELLKSPGIPLSWSPDGRQILFVEQHKLFLLPLEGGKAPIPIGVAAGAVANGAEISPDGKYFAFTSSESGRYEVYIEAMPPGTGKWQISINGGAYPRWRKDGKELFFLTYDLKMMAVDIQTAQRVGAGVPHALLQIEGVTVGGQLYDVNSDGQQFLIASAFQNRVDAPIAVVLNWWAGLGK
jgi:Tol biopolymer transport system component